MSRTWGSALTAFRRMLLAVLVGLSLAGTSAWASIEVYEFEDEQTREQYQRLTAELRCPMCQNQNIADSDAAIAQDLRREVRRLLVEGRNEQEVVDYMMERYGDFIVYRPRFDASTFLLWFGPLLVALIGLAVVIGLVRSRGVRHAEDPAPVDRKKLEQLLNDREKT